jgi:hypothetical protein
MKPSSLIIILLLVLLIGSNAFWMWLQIQSGVGAFYGNRQLLQTQDRSVQLISAFAQGQTKDDVMRRIESLYGYSPHGHTNGSFSIDYMHFEFDGSGNLLQVKNAESKADPP